MKTCLYDSPLLYSKTGVYRGIHCFSYFAKKHRLWALIKLLGDAVLTNTHNLCFEQEYEKYQNFLSENFPFLVVKFSIYLKKVCFGNEINLCFLVQEVPLGLLNPLTLVMLNKLRRHTNFQLSAIQNT